MAIYHCDVKIGSRGQGHSATAAAAYRAAGLIHDDRTGNAHDYSRKQGVWGSEILAPDRAPTWMRQRAVLWNAVEQTEKRKDAQLYREVVIALPVELTHEQKQQVVRRYVRETFVAKGMIADISFHDFQGRNPHAHILLTLREIEADRFGKKNRDWNRKALVFEWREQWAHAANQALERAGHSARIDHRSLKARGLSRIPQIHLGRAVIKMERAGIRTDKGDTYRRIAAANQDLQQLMRVEAELKRQLQAAIANDNRASVQQRKTSQDRYQEVTKTVMQSGHTSSPAPTPSHSSPPSSSPDLTRRAVLRQIKGLTAERYDIGLKNQTTGEMLQRTWKPEEVETAIPWLKSMNARGYDIYIRPSSSCGLVLVDDLTLGALQQMEADRLKPAVIVQTSPMNYQAWVRLSESPLDKARATAAAKLLAERYGGDPNSADWRHYGRLSGFTNQKGIHTQNNGQQPYVLLESYYGKPAENAANLLAEAQNRFQARSAFSPQHPARTDSTNRQRAAQAFRTLYQHRRTRYGPVQDPSREDWTICTHLANQGFDHEAMTYALRQESPNLDQRKKGHVDDYVHRTVTKVIQHSAQHQNEQQALHAYLETIEHER